MKQASDILRTGTYGSKAYTALFLAGMSDWMSIAAFSENAVPSKVGEVKVVHVHQRSKFGLRLGLNPVLAADDEIVMIVPQLSEIITARQLYNRLKKVIEGAERSFREDEKLYFFPRCLYDFGMSGSDLPYREGRSISVTESLELDEVKLFLKNHFTYMAAYDKWPYLTSDISREDGITIAELKAVAKQLLRPTSIGRIEDEFIKQQRETLVKSFISGCTSFFRTFDDKQPSRLYPTHTIGIVKAEDPMLKFRNVTDKHVLEWSHSSNGYIARHGDPITQLKEKLADPELPEFMKLTKELQSRPAGLPDVALLVCRYPMYRKEYFKEA